MLNETGNCWGRIWRSMRPSKSSNSTTSCRRRSTSRTRTTPTIRRISCSRTRCQPHSSASGPSSNQCASYDYSLPMIIDLRLEATSNADVKSTLRAQAFFKRGMKLHSPDSHVGVIVGKTNVELHYQLPTERDVEDFSFVMRLEYEGGRDNYDGMKLSRYGDQSINFLHQSFNITSVALLCRHLRATRSSGAVPRAAARGERTLPAVVVRQRANARCARERPT